jgi:PucR C-terminal helix-turn-helix domain
MGGGAGAAADHAIASIDLRSRAALRRATADRLRARRAEVYEAVIHRALSVAPPTGAEAPGYVEGLRDAIPAAVEHAFDAIEFGEERAGPTPTAIFLQAAASARSEVGLEVVLRRYASGYSTLSDFLHQEAQRLPGGGPEYAAMQRGLTGLFDRFVAEVSEVYRREEAKALPSPHQRRLERIRRLLAGELVDPEGLDYPLDGHHLAGLLAGVDAETVASGLASELDRRLLVAEKSTAGCAVWFGGGRPFSEEEFERMTEHLVNKVTGVSLGEPGESVVGWRRSRRQAEVAQLIAERTAGGVVRYREVALVAAAVRDPDLSRFLIDTYVEPLGGHQSALGRTMVALLGVSGNASSAAARLGVSRHTVASRTRTVEERLGRPLGTCAAQLETALRLAELGP